MAGDVLVLVPLRHPFPQEALVAGMLPNFFVEIQAGERIPEKLGGFLGCPNRPSVPTASQNIALQFQLLDNLFEVGCHDL